MFRCCLRLAAGAGFPCTYKEGDILQHPARQVDGPQHQRGDIYILGTAGGPLGLRMVIDIVRKHSHTGQGQVRATHLRAPRVPTGPAPAVTTKYTKHYTQCKGMEVGFCAGGAGTLWALEPDACHLLKHITYACTMLDFQERGLDGVGRDQEEYNRLAAGWAF
jgi:hypothetical protein